MSLLSSLLVVQDQVKKHLGGRDGEEEGEGGRVQVTACLQLGVRRICGHNIRNNRAKHAQGIILE